MIDCPRAKSSMTPCIARDGHLALCQTSEEDPRTHELRHPWRCVGCLERPRTLLVDLAKKYEPARRYVQTKDPNAIADRLTELVTAYVESKEPN